ncbi:primase-helicase family protein [Methylocystis sp. IM3]|uniref:primase-helicase family protein n=1 Tax=unclassified Methylocystis TaxID=2625913 RepID=UPI0030FA0D31
MTEHIIEKDPARGQGETGPHSNPNATENSSTGINGKPHPFAKSVPVSIEMVRFVKEGGPLTKKISLDADGELVSDGSQCRMCEGVQERLPLKDWREFAEILDKTPRDTAYGVGRLKEQFGDSVVVEVIGKVTTGAARSKESISYREGEPAFALLDHDTKEMPDAVRERLDALGGLHGALDHICPELRQAGYICRKSTSSGVYIKKTDEKPGKKFQKDGEHIYLLVRDGSDTKRLLDTLHTRAWANGLGWHMLSKNGSYLSRSIVDRSVSDASRLVFEAPPDLDHPSLTQDRPEPQIHDGLPFDSRKYCLDLTAAESKACADAIAASKARLKPEADKRRKKFEEQRVAEALDRGVDPETAKRMAQQWTKGVLLPDAVLDFRRHKLGFVTVADILACPENYLEKYIPDPLDGDDLHYSSAAKVRQREDGSVYVVSFAHGLVTEYNFRSDDCLDDPAIRARINELHRQTESLDTLSADFAEIKDEAIKLFANSSDNYRGDPKERRYFYTQWKMDAKTLIKRLRQEDDTRRREQEAGRGGNPDDQKVAEINKDHFIAYEGSRIFVFHEKYDNVLERRFYDRIRPKDFEIAHENHRVPVVTANGIHDMGFGQYWLRHPERRQYLGGVVFDPANRHRPDQFNLWSGFRVEAKRGSWKKFRKHLYKVVCRRDKRLFKYLIRWLANAVQHPEKQGEVVIVMRGGKGVGKGFLGRVMVSLFGLHGMHISNAEHLVGKFNQHLQGCCLLFADEAFYAGDKKHIGILNRIITEHSLSIEGKGKDIVESKNYIHMIMASNDDWVIPASRDERRYCVFDVSDEHKQDTVYFGAVQKELDNGGYEAMLYDLQQVDLKNFSVRDYPETEALQDQKLRSLKPEERWLHRILSQGYIRRSDSGLNSMETWHEAVTTDFLYESYEKFAKENGARGWLNPVHFGRFMHDMGFMTKTQSREAFHGEAGRGLDVRVRYNDDRKPAYRLGTLAQAREAFAKATGLALTWPEDEELDGVDEEPSM